MCRQLTGERSTARDFDSFKIQPACQRVQLISEFCYHSGLIDTRFLVASEDQQQFVFTIGFEINASDDPVIKQEWEDVVTPLAFASRHIDFNSIVEIEKALGSWSKPHNRIER
jgi:hypothetical protein